MKSSILSVGIPFNAGEANLTPILLAAHPRWVSRIWPMFIREATPSGFKIISTGVPSSRKGISSRGTTRETTPLFPWRPASLSPTWIFLVCATYTFTWRITPVGRSTPSDLSKIWMPTTFPPSPPGSLSDESLTSFALSPKMACRRRSSGVSSVSPFGVIFPTNMSPSWTVAPSRTTPSSSRSFNFASPTLGISRVIVSGPSFVSRISVTYDSMWIES